MLIAALVMVFAVFGIAGVGAIQQQGRCDSLDPSQWRSLDDRARDRLASDIEACDALNGTRVTELRGLLGPPRNIDRTPPPRGGTSWRYPTGAGALRPHVLSVHVTPDGVVDEAQLEGV